jgi:uncharacterized membrane protein YczE
MSGSQGWVTFAKRLPELILGLFLLAVAIICNLNSGLGLHPWGVLHQGLSVITGMSLGTTTQLVGLVVIVLGWWMGFAPGIGTIMNMWLVGWFVDVIAASRLIPSPVDIGGRLLLVMASILITGLGTWLYLRPQLGAGPRDGLMVGLVRKLDKPVWMVRGCIEVLVLASGFLMGGIVGLGTVVVALTVGYSIQFFFKIGRYDGKTKQYNLYEQIRELTGKK